MAVEALAHVAWPALVIVENDYLLEVAGGVEEGGR